MGWEAGVILEVVLLVTLMGQSPSQPPQFPPLAETIEPGAPGEQDLEVAPAEPVPAVGATAEDRATLNSFDSPASRSGPIPSPRDSMGEERVGGRDEACRVRPAVWLAERLGVLLGPVRQANLLLPERLDPFDGELPSSQSQSPEPVPVPLPEQARLLGLHQLPIRPAGDDPAQWHWQSQAGGSFRQGNTSNTNLRSSTRIERTSHRSLWRGKLGLNYDRSSGDDPNLRAYAETVLDCNLRGLWIYYVREDAEYDEVRRIDMRSVTSGGLGFRFVDRLTERLVVRTGPTISHIEFDDDAAADDETLHGWLVELDYRKLMGESARFELTTSAFPDFQSDDRFRLLNDAALLFPIAGKSSPWNWKLGIRNQLERIPARNTRISDVEGYFAITYAR